MSFYITQLYTREAANTGIKLPLSNPRTGQPFKDKDGNQVYIFLRGQDSDDYRALDAQIKREGSAVWTAGEKGETDDERRASGFAAWQTFNLSPATRNRRIAGLIVGVTGENPCTYAKALELVENAPQIADLIFMEAGIRESFLANVSANSTPSPEPSSV